jgi:hypothetical protein
VLERCEQLVRARVAQATAEDVDRIRAAAGALLAEAHRVASSARPV